MNSNSLDYLYEICLHIQGVQLEVKSHCSIKVMWKKGSQSIQTQKEAQSDQKNYFLIDEKLTMRTSIQQDCLSYNLAQKMTQILVVLHVEDKVKLAGICPLDIGSILQDQFIQIQGKPSQLDQDALSNVNQKFELPLIQCPDKHGRVIFTLNAVYLKQINSDEISNFSQSTRKSPQSLMNLSRLNMELNNIPKYPKIQEGSSKMLQRKENILDQTCNTLEKAHKHKIEINKLNTQITEMNNSLIKKDQELQLKDELYENTLIELSKFKTLCNQNSQQQTEASSKYSDQEKNIQLLQDQIQFQQVDNEKVLKQFTLLQQTFLINQQNFKEIIQKNENEQKQLKQKLQDQSFTQRKLDNYETQIQKIEDLNNEQKQKIQETNSELLEFQLFKSSSTQELNQIKKLYQETQQSHKISVQKIEQLQSIIQNFQNDKAKWETIEKELSILNREKQVIIRINDQNQGKINDNLRMESSNIQSQLVLEVQTIRAKLEDQVEQHKHLEKLHQSLQENSLDEQNKFRDKSCKLKTKNVQMKQQNDTLEQEVNQLNLQIVRELDKLMKKQDQLTWKNCLNCSRITNQ